MQRKLSAEAGKLPNMPAKESQTQKLTGEPIERHSESAPLITVGVWTEAVVATERITSITRANRIVI